jgi:nuclear-control-of-ATPase protein 2
MVLDLGRDYYKLSGPKLDALGERVKAGDMEQVLRIYEQEMQVRTNAVYQDLADDQSPLKNALMGSLVRTLLIQVQKTKVRHAHDDR